MASKDKSELFEENIRLKQSVSNIKHSLDTVSVMTMDDIQTLNRSKRRWANIKARCRISPICTLVVIAVLTAAVALYLLVGNYRLTKSASAVAAAAKASKATQWSGPQGCVSGTKQMFPDIDYALFGYNIIRGYPMAVGHDPGLTRPIFKADYNGKKHTADCKYSIPKGLTVVPDISCVTSFSSETIRDSYQLAKSLEASAEVSGGGWNAEFSASAEYKQKSNEVSSKESVYINSVAKCDYYLSIMDEVKPPSLDESFIEKAKTLKTKQDVFNFFEYYGTHYLKEVTFGARLIYESKMTNSDFSSLSEKSVSVSISASYDGVARVAGKASLSADEKKQAQEFRSKTQTKTISVGAPPPANGSTDAWASTVKDSPVPTKFKMGGIEELFSKKFMGGLVKDYDRLSKLIKTARAEYCKHLKDKGVVFDCKKLDSYVYFKDVALKGKAFAVFTGTDHDVRKCIQVCMGEKECVAAVWKKDARPQHQGCYLYEAGSFTLEKSKGSKVVIFTDSIKKSEKITLIKSAEFAGTPSAKFERVDYRGCLDRCIRDKLCVAFRSYQLVHRKCNLYQQSVVTEDSIKLSIFGSDSIVAFPGQRKKLAKEKAKRKG